MVTGLETIGRLAATAAARALYGRLLATRETRLLRQVEDLISELGADGKSESEIEEAMASASPEISEVLNLYFMLLLAATGEKTAKAMARMTAHYFYNRKASDRFFRRTGSLLSQIQDSELVRLSHLIRWIVDNRGGASALEVHLYGTSVNGVIHPYSELRFTRYMSSGKGVEERCKFSGDDEYFTVFRLLKQHGFAQELPGGGLGNSHALGMLILEPALADLHEMARFLPEGAGQHGTEPA